MPVTVTIEHYGSTIATIETARPDLAAQLVYEAVNASNAEECSCSFEDFVAHLTDNEAYDVDPNFYQNGNNNLTIEESASRAAAIVADILNREGNVDTDDLDTIEGTVTDAIANYGISRDTLYTLAGQIAKARRDDAFYLGLPLASVFNYKVYEELITYD